MVSYINNIFVVSSRELLEKFRAQLPDAPGLPPALLAENDISERVPMLEDVDDSEAETRIDVPGVSLLQQTSSTKNSNQLQSSIFGAFLGTSSRNREPSRPRFDRSLLLRGELTVPRADYTETYTAW